MEKSTLYTIDGSSTREYVFRKCVLSDKESYCAFGCFAMVMDGEIILNCKKQNTIIRKGELLQGGCDVSWTASGVATILVVEEFRKNDSGPCRGLKF